MNGDMKTVEVRTPSRPRQRQSTYVDYGDSPVKEARYFAVCSELDAARKAAEHAGLRFNVKAWFADRTDYTYSAWKEYVRCRLLSSLTGFACSHRKAHQDATQAAKPGESVTGFLHQNGRGKFLSTAGQVAFKEAVDSLKHPTEKATRALAAVHALKDGARRGRTPTRCIHSLGSCHSGRPLSCSFNPSTIRKAVNRLVPPRRARAQSRRRMEAAQ